MGVVADFSGYATKNGLKCSDGRTIMAGAFQHTDKNRVPLVWQHQHNEATNVLGHAILEAREDGIYAHGFFNDSEMGKHAKQMVKHGDITALSIYANNLSQQGKDVLHGDIREVSLVLSGANPGALIDSVNLAHGYMDEETEAIIYTGLTLTHKDQGETVASAATESKKDEDLTVKEVFETLTEVQKQVVYFMLGEVADDADDADDADSKKGDDEAKHSDDDLNAIFHSMTESQQKAVHLMLGEALKKNESTTTNDSDIIQHQEGTNVTHIFDQTQQASGAARNTLSHAQIQTIVEDGIKLGSFKESFLQHAGEYGITNIDLLFPDAKATSSSPELLARQAEWVPLVLNATKKAPFGKIKSIVADLTAAEARAKGYIKGKQKVDEVIALLRRTTGPTTVYKKQKLDRDDLIDITDFDVVAWLKWEIRFMLNEELARAILVGDGRSSMSDDKIKDPAGSTDGVGIRSIYNDNEMYAHKVELQANVSASNIIDSISRSRTAYRGSGNPTFYTTDTIVTDLLLLKDKMGRRLYETMEALASALRVKEIVAVEVLEETPNLVGIMVNLVDYTLGSNKGGEINFFEDFDIDFNQNKYLMETRVSGALTKPKSAVVITREQGELVAPTAPSFNGVNNTITIPSKTGVEYFIDDAVVAAGAKVITADTTVTAAPAAGHYFAANTNNSWSFTYTD